MHAVCKSFNVKKSMKDKGNGAVQVVNHTAMMNENVHSHHGKSQTLDFTDLQPVQFVTEKLHIRQNNNMQCVSDIAPSEGANVHQECQKGINVQKRLPRAN